MKFWVRVLLLSAVVGGLCGLPGAQANPLQDGAVVDLKGASDALKTADFHLRGGILPLGGICAAGIGFGQLGIRPMVGALTTLGGIGMMFAPSLVTSAQSVAQASTGPLAISAAPGAFLSWLSWAYVLLPEVCALALGRLYFRLRLRRRTA